MTASEFDHEELHVRRGARSGLPIAVAIHSTAAGPAIGGCRIRTYSDWRDGIEDVLRLSRAMTLKSAIAGLSHGGGKTVAMAPAMMLSPEDRAELIRDIADVIAGLDGSYITGPDIGTTEADMTTIHALTGGQAWCRPVAEGGSGSSSEATARGVLAALKAAVSHALLRDSAKGLTVGVIGFGSVGRLVAQSLAREGANVTAVDVNPHLRDAAATVGVAWGAGDPLRQDFDIIVPAATGGLLTTESVAQARTSVIVGPANNQLADDSVAQVLADRGITWVPDVAASAGGVIHAVCREELGLGEQETEARIESIGDRVTQILEQASRDGVSSLEAAWALAGPSSARRRSSTPVRRPARTA